MRPDAERDWSIAGVTVESNGPQTKRMSHLQVRLACSRVSYLYSRRDRLTYKNNIKKETAATLRLPPADDAHARRGEEHARARAC